MAVVWIVLAVLFCAGAMEGQTQRASACFGTSGCDHMQLSCPNPRRIFILKIQYGSKVANTSCSGSGLCQPFCCTRGSSDCVWNYSDYHMGLVYTDYRCWKSTSCSGQVTQASTPCLGYTPLSTYAEAEYSCLRDEDITYFHLKTTITAPAVAIHYDSTDFTNYPVTMGDNQTWHCQVDTADCIQRQVDVILVKEKYTAVNTSSCSSVGWSGGPFLSCFSDFRYLSLTTSTPFGASVRVYRSNRLASGWAVVNAKDGANLTVTCGYTDQTVVSPCRDAATRSTSQSLTSSGTTPTPAFPSVKSEDRASRGEMTGVAVAGWVLAVVLAVLLTVLSVLLLRRHGGWKSTMQFLKGKSSSGHPAAARDQNTNNLHVNSDTADASHHTSPASVYVNVTSGLAVSSDRVYVNGVSGQPRNENQGEYSPLDWSRDPANIYSPLRTE